MAAKRSLEMVVYDPAAAAQREAKRARPSAAEAGALVPYDAALPADDDAEPIMDAVPLNAIAPPKLPRLPPAPASGDEPPCLRRHILPALGLRADLPVHFVDQKRVTGTDLDPHQNRFRIPTDGVLRRLVPLLTLEELDSANLLHGPPPRKQPEPEPAENGAAAAGEEQGKKKKKKGRVHGGLAVKLVDLAAGASSELKLARWESSHGTIVKGERYMDFVRRCSFGVHDVVEIWAFKQRAFRLFGTDVHQESALHLLVVRRDDREQGCRYCRGPPRPASIEHERVDHGGVDASQDKLH